MIVFEEELFVYSCNRLHFGDLLIHQGLCETWLIQFIVTELSVSNKVNNNIFFKLLSVLCCELEYKADILDALGIHMEDGCIDCLHKI